MQPHHTASRALQSHGGLCASRHSLLRAHVTGEFSFCTHDHAIIIGTDLQFVTLPAHVSVKNTTRDGGSTDCTHGLHRFYTVSNMPICIALWLERSKNIAHNGKSSWVQFLTIALLHWLWCSWSLLCTTYASHSRLNYAPLQGVPKKMTNRMQQTDRREKND